MPEITRSPLTTKRWYSEVCEFYDIPHNLARTAGIEAKYYIKFPAIQKRRLQAIKRIRFQYRGSLLHFGNLQTDEAKSRSWQNHFMCCIWSEKTNRQRIDFHEKVMQCIKEMKELRVTALSDSQELRVLDFGCGTTLFGRLVAERYPDIELMLCDINGFHFRFAAHRTRVFLGNVRLFPIDDPYDNCKNFGPLDLIYCYTVFEHLPNTGKVIKHFVRCLKPGGVLIETYTGHSKRTPHKSDTWSSYLERDINLDYLKKNLHLLYGVFPNKGSDGSYEEGGSTRFWIKKPFDQNLAKELQRILASDLNISVRTKIKSFLDDMKDMVYAYSHLF